MTNNQFFPDIAIPPGESLQELLDEYGMTQAQLAERMGRPKKTINEIVHGKAKITADTAVQLERVLQVPASFWLNLQSKYEEDLARIKEKEQLDLSLEMTKNFPIKAMAANGWIEEKKDKHEMAKVILEFFSVANFEVWGTSWYSRLVGNVAFRKSDKFELSDYSLAAWVRQGEKVAAKMDCKSFNANLLRKRIPDIRKLTREEPKVFLPKLKEIGRECGIAFVFVKEVPKLPVYGVTYWLSADKVVVQLTIRQKADDHLWFSIFHELGHILKHGKRDFYLGEDSWEREADEFAQQTLIPQDQYKVFVQKGKFSKESVSYFADLIGVSAGIVVGRLQHDKLIPYSNLNALKRKYVWTQ